VQNPNCWTARILPMICQCCNTFGCIGYIFVYFCYMLLLLPTDINRLQAVATRRSRLDNMTLVDIILPPARHLDGFELPKDHNFCKQPKDPKVCPSKLAVTCRLRWIVLQILYQRAWFDF
jgi:hypothetical protein